MLLLTYFYRKKELFKDLYYFLLERALKDFWVSINSFFKLETSDMFSPTFWRIESWSWSIVFSIFSSLADSDSICEVREVLRSRIDSIWFFSGESFSEKTCSEISVMVSEETPAE